MEEIPRASSSVSIPKTAWDCTNYEDTWGTFDRHM